MFGLNLMNVSVLLMDDVLSQRCGQTHESSLVRRSAAAIADHARGAACGGGWPRSNPWDQPDAWHWVGECILSRRYSSVHYIVPVSDAIRRARSVV